MNDKIEACECGRTEQETWFTWDILDPYRSSGAYTFPILGDKYYTRRCACGWRIKRATEEDRDAAWNSVMAAVRMAKRATGGFATQSSCKRRPSAMSEKLTVEEIVERLGSQIEDTRQMEALGREDTRILLAAIREMQEETNSQKRYVYKLHQLFNEILQSCANAMNTGLVGEPKDNGIDLTHLPKGKPTAYSEGGRAR